MAETKSSTASSSSNLSDRSNSLNSMFPLDFDQVAELQKIAVSICTKHATSALYSFRQFPMVPLAYLNMAEQGLGELLKTHRRVWDSVVPSNGSSETGQRNLEFFMQAQSRFWNSLLAPLGIEQPKSVEPGSPGTAHSAKPAEGNGKVCER